MLEVLSRSINGRLCEWTTESKTLKTPEILYIDYSPESIPSFAEACLTRSAAGFELRSVNSEERAAVIPLDIPTPMSAYIECDGEVVTEGENTVCVRAFPDHYPDLIPESGGEVYVLKNAFELRRDPRQLIRSLVNLREHIGPDKLIYAPGIMDVTNTALLSYLGVDLFDSSLLLHGASTGRLLLPEGSIEAETAQWLVDDADETTAVEFNLRSAWKELNLVRHSIRQGSLRELVETRMNADPWNVAALKILDREFFDFQERQTPVTGATVHCNSKQSLFRPEVKRFRKRLMDRYRPPEHKEILVFLPCSARKPYSTSKTHRILQQVTRGVENSEVVHEAIITSPLGVVPREIETVYPAAHYDLPVTGHWDCYEGEMIRETASHIASLGYQRVICHDGTDFVRDELECIDTGGNDPLSSASMTRLREVLEDLCSAAMKVTRDRDRWGNMRSIARFQFGEGGEELLEGCTISGRYPWSRIMDGDTQVGMLTPERGIFSLTLDGGRRLFNTNTNWVKMDDFNLRGSLFAVGVIDADSRIRIDDEVIILKDGELEAVGVASMCGEDMIKMSRGEAVNTRHIRDD